MAMTPAGKELPRKVRKARKGQTPRTTNLSRLRKPDEMSLEEWQAGLRRQVGREQKFRIANTGDQPFFSEFQVTNPQTRQSYRVAIRGACRGENFCSCPDFATNSLGTCKHIEFTQAYLERKRGGKSALRAGFQPA